MLFVVIHYTSALHCWMWSIFHSTNDILFQKWIIYFMHLLQISDNCLLGCIPYIQRMLSSSIKPTGMTKSNVVGWPNIGECDKTSNFQHLNLVFREYLWWAYSYNGACSQLTPLLLLISFGQPEWCASFMEKLHQNLPNDYFYHISIP